MVPLLIGHVGALWRYPVKSMRGEPLTTTRVWWHGVEGDRRYAFIRTAHASAFPWLTGRELPNLIRYHPTFTQPDEPITSPIRITTPEDEQLPLTDPHLHARLAHAVGEPVQLFQLGRGAFDSAGLSIITTTTLAILGRAVSQPTRAQRFRANIIIATDAHLSFPEDRWMGAALRFGSRADSVTIRVFRPIKRCMMVNLDPETAVQEPAVLRTIVQEHDQHAGVYGATEQVGTLVVGDPVWLMHA